MSSHSDYGLLKKVFLKPAKVAFINQNKIDSQWSDLNFIGKPNYSAALTEYEEFESLVKSEGAEVLHFSKDDAVSMDSIYCRDASIVTDYGIILCNMGKEQRLPETKACRKDYFEKGMKILGEVTAPGTIEGGDVAWIDKNTLAVAHGYRTNDEGFRQLKEILTPYNIDVIQVDLPHYKGESDVFHLMSFFSPIDNLKAVVYSTYMPVRFRELLLSKGYELIEVPEEEFESMGCNILAIAPSKCIMVKGNPITRDRLLAAGCQVHEYSGNEISVKGGGGPTCLTRPIIRE